MGQWCKETVAISPFLPDNPALCYPRVCGAQTLGISYSILQTYFRRQRAPTPALSAPAHKAPAQQSHQWVGCGLALEGTGLRPNLCSPGWGARGGEWRAGQCGGAGKPKGENGREPPSPCPPNFLLRLSGKNALLLLPGHLKPQERSWEPRASF